VGSFGIYNLRMYLILMLLQNAAEQRPFHSRKFIIYQQISGTSRQLTNA